MITVDPGKFWDSMKKDLIFLIIQGNEILVIF